MPDGDKPVELHPVDELAAAVDRVLVSIRTQLAATAPGLTVEHVGATSLGDGSTKGDVDVNIRLRAAEFDDVVRSLRGRFEVAQPENWTPTYASFSDSTQELPLGIQVCVEGSGDDFLVALRERFRADDELRRRYDEVKRRAAPLGAEAYWQAKDTFLRPLLGRSEDLES